MRRRTILISLATCLAVLGIGGACYVFWGHTNHAGGKEPGRATTAFADAAVDRADDPDPISPPKLPETSPPSGLSIKTWGARDGFPVIRKPWYVSAAQGDTLLALDEPVLGLVIGTEVRAYSTNQLNEHEMVLDEIAGTPVLVTY